MRIVHFADVHIGVESYGKTDPQTGLSSRLADFLSSFDEVVDYAIESRADLALFCGDAYKSRDPSQTHQREFARRIAKLSAANVPVFLVEGNHDIPNVTGRATSLDIFRTLSVPNVHIGSILRTYTIDTPSGPLQIVAVPWVRRGTFLSREDTRGMNPDQVTDMIQQRLSDAVAGCAQNLDPSIPAVFAGHVTVSGSKTSSEQSMMLGRDHVLLHSSVALPAFDYVALGHVHRHQILGKAPHVVYAGALERVDFGEEKDTKGFCVIELDPSKMQGTRMTDFEFTPVNARNMVTIDAEIKPNDPDPTATAVAAIGKHDIDGAIVRVRVKLPGQLENQLQDSELRKALEPAHYIASISKEILDAPRVRLGDTHSEGLNPKDALTAYLKTRDITEERAELLMNKAQELFDTVSTEETGL
ncbi:MAG: exonuclease SbcCD subunit D [Chloroflexi bacterium]|nr:exonuclease SbcCD subunit D [Chloroflexota bacterium]